MRLKVNEDKSGVHHYSKAQLLGFGFYKDKRGVQTRVSPKSYRHFRAKLKRLTSRRHSVSMDVRLGRLNSLIQGWLGYFGIAKAGKRLRDIDGWVRRRLRMCIWKQWKRVRTRLRCLVRLGIPKGKAYEWANTRKGYWRVSRSPILHRAISTARLEQRGYHSIYASYQRRHSILTNRRDTRPVRPVV